MNKPLPLLLKTALALLAFAGNSLLCRAALAGENIEPASFTALRLSSGALTLVMILLLKQNTSPLFKGINRSQLASGALLFAYAASFSFAYIELDAGVGALVLFAAVQLSMLLLGLFRGQKPSRNDLIGMALAFAGLYYLLAPSGQQGISFASSGLMLCSGVAWGLYSLNGRGSTTPVVDTSRAFALSLPLCLLLTPWLLSESTWTAYGISLAIASGAITSALGYWLWYQVLPQLRVSTAASSQLLVPLIATLLGSLWLGEQLSLQLLLASVAILGGIGLTLIKKT